MLCANSGGRRQKRQPARTSGLPSLALTGARGGVYRRPFGGAQECYFHRATRALRLTALRRRQGEENEESVGRARKNGKTPYPAAENTMGDHSASTQL